MPRYRPEPAPAVAFALPRGYLAALARAVAAGVLTEAERAAMIDGGVAALSDQRADTGERLRAFLVARATEATREVGR